MEFGIFWIAGPIEDVGAATTFSTTIFLRTPADTAGSIKEII